MKVLKLLAASMLFIAAPSYGANARCENCDQQGFEGVAQALGPGDHVVFSMSQGIAIGFTNECDTTTPGFDPAAAVLCVFPRPLTADEAAQFAAAQRIHRDTGGSMKYERVVPIRNIPFPPGMSIAHLSSHEYARRPADWHRLSMATVQWARTFMGTAGNSAQWWQSLGSIVGLAGTQVEITVEFPDGGKVTFKVDYGDETMAEQVGPIRDADGNVIPTPSDSPTIMSGLYTFSGSSGQNAMNVHLSALGWAMRFPQPTASCPNIGRLIYECGWVGGDMRNVSCKMLTRC